MTKAESLRPIRNNTSLKLKYYPIWDEDCLRPIRNNTSLKPIEIRYLKDTKFKTY